MSEHQQYSDEHAAGRLTTHEAVCSERYLNITTLMTQLAARIGKLEGLVWVIAGSLIVGMAGLIVTLAIRGHG